MSIKYDGDFLIEQPIGKPEISYPLRRESGAFQLRQRVSIHADGYDAKNVAGNIGEIVHPVYTDAILVAEEEFEYVSAEVIHFTLVYANLPNAYSEPGGSTAYAFPGWLNQRPLQNIEVPVRRNIEFFLTEDFSQIPHIPRFRPVNTNGWDVDILNDGGGVVVQTVPSRDAYKGWVGGSLSGTDGIDGAEANVGLGYVELSVAASRIENYAGNIWMRMTDWVRAQ